MGKKDTEGQSFGKRSLDAMKKAGSSAARLAKIGKLNTQISSEKDRIRKVQMEIGKVYFETYCEAPHPPLAEACGKIRASLNLIEELQDRIQELKDGSDAEPDDDYIYH